MMKIKHSLVSISIIIFLSIVCIYKIFFEKTEVALVNFQPFLSSPIAVSCENRLVRYRIISTQEFFENRKNYDFVIFFGMGLKIDENGQKYLKKYTEEGNPVMVISATTPENDICNIEKDKAEKVSEYLFAGNKKSYKSLANYIRKEIDGKWFGIGTIEEATPAPEDVFYHLSDEESFDDIDKFDSYLKKNGYFHPGGPKIAIISPFTNPFGGNAEDIHAMIKCLDEKGINVYPIHSMMNRRKFVEMVKPDGIIYFAHGRIAFGPGADSLLRSIKKFNCPIFNPLTVLSDKKSWMEDKIGMFGGYMSQSIAMPEIDGGTYPYVVNVQSSDKNKIVRNVADSSRLEKFCEAVRKTMNLKTMPAKEKKVAIYFFKGPGHQSLTAQVLDVVPSLFNVMQELKNRGYEVNLPKSAKDLEKIIAPSSGIENGSAEDNMDNGDVYIDTKEFDKWIHENLSSEQIENLHAMYGNLADAGERIKIKAYKFGNIVLIPQPASGESKDHFQMVHGTDQAPPYRYIAAYLWSKEKFKADAIIHFGTHGSLEFTPKKQIALSDNDWSDALIGGIPHYYVYTIANVGEGMIAKRRSYATLVSYQTPPFEESNMRAAYSALKTCIQNYFGSKDEKVKKLFAEKVRTETEKLGLDKDLQIKPGAEYDEETIERIENYSEEIANQKIYGTLHTIGKKFTSDETKNTVIQMCCDPMAYSLAAIDLEKGKITAANYKSEAFISNKYLTRSKEIIHRILDGKVFGREDICKEARITAEEYRDAFPDIPAGMQMHDAGDTKNINFAIRNLTSAIMNVGKYKKAIETSTGAELEGIVNALNGGYISPSSGGDAIENPEALPSGRNMYGVNELKTPTEGAWINGKALAETTLENYKKTHGEYPRKVSYTFWSGEFISSGGTTIAQALYMLGVEPVRDGMGRVADVRLIPSEELGRPRIDIVVQTSGQFRDMATSRLVLLDKAVKMAAEAGDNEKYPNFVHRGIIDSEQQLVKDGIAPKMARQLAGTRIFGGLNGNYGTGIMDMIFSGDKWENSSEIAKTYIVNMGAAYTDTDNWGDFNKGLFKAALSNTDIIVQPRQSNTWGALSLDHVFEFMGGLNLAVKEVTGKEPETIFADYRNRNNYKMQSLKDAIGIESRSTILNPHFISKVTKGGSSDAMRIMEIIENTYGWNVCKPEVIDKELWDGIYEMWIKDKAGLGTKTFFENSCPAALEQITGIMLETARKGLWKAGEEKINTLSELNAELIRKYGSSEGNIGNSNEKLKEFIADNIKDKEKANLYKKQNQTKGVILKEQQEAMPEEKDDMVSRYTTYVITGLLTLFVVGMIIFRLRKKEE